MKYDHIDICVSVASKDGLRRSEERVTFRTDDECENGIINLYPDITYQSWKGFGGALTESTGYNYNKMGGNDRKQLCEAYFGDNDLRYSQLRIPIDSCDFSLGHYEAVSKDDPAFTCFDLSRVEENIFPMLDDIIKQLGHSPEIMLTPWSPPAYMKTNGDRNHGGHLKENYRQIWADYICNYVCEFRKRGYDVRRISLQNEPKASQTWDSCIYSAKEERDFLNVYMREAVRKYGLDDLEIFIWDHNKERAFERASVIIDDETTDLVTGIAFHWYSGDHFGNLKLIKERFPGKRLILSEACIEFSKYEKGNELVNAQKYAHDIIGNMKNGMDMFLDWNMLLDEQGGPNHVSNFCDAPFLYDEKSSRLIKRNIEGYLWHFSHFIRPGDRLIATSVFSEYVETVAFRDDEGRLKVVILNRQTHGCMADIRIPAFSADENGRTGDLVAGIKIEPMSVSTLMIE